MCYRSSLNAPYSPTAEVSTGDVGITWALDIGWNESLQFTEMKICR